MALTADRNLDYFASQESAEYGVDDDVIIYKGALVGRNRSTGYARALAAGDEFLGVADRRADNTAPGHAAGGVRVKVQQNIDIAHPLAGVSLGDVGKEVFASDDSTLTLTPTGHSRVGRIVGVDAPNVARVRCQPVTVVSGVFGNEPIITLADATQTLTLDHVNRVLLMANTAARTLTLPPVAGVRAGGWIRVIKTNSAAFAITLDGNGAELIDGAATLGTIDAQYDCALLLCTGTEWIVLSRDIA